MAKSGFYINGVDIATNWPDKSYLIDRYPTFQGSLKQAGLWTWGDNTYGEIGDNTRVNTSSPVQTIAGGANWQTASSGRLYNAAIKTDGTLWVWGVNVSGQLGDGTVLSKSSPIQTIAGGTNWKQISAGADHAGAIKTDGTLWVWGNNSSGQLGDNTRVNKSSPIQTISGGTNWKQISCGYSCSAAIKTNGTLWVWGLGYLGDNLARSTSSPVQTVAAGTNWKTAYAGYYHFAGIKNDGTLWLWGNNTYGQLGTNNVTSYDSPVQTIAGGTNWKSVTGYGSSTAGIKTDGTLWTWGDNRKGQLGDNTVTHRSSPVQTIAGGTNWKSLGQAPGLTYSCAALKTDGTLWLWGYNITGQLGDGTVTDRASPVQTVSGGYNWKAIATGDSNMIAIRDDSADPI